MNGTGAGAPSLLSPMQRMALACGLTAVVVTSWAVVLWMNDGTGENGRLGTPAAATSSSLLMWVVMMTAMMLPGAVSVTMLYARFQRGHQPDRSPLAYAPLFVLGYLAVWGGFAMFAAGIQGTLVQFALMRPQAMKLDNDAAAAVLLAAGLYQLTPLKNACLHRCRTPLGFFMTCWRDGAGGALAMGLRYGASCLGCCWALMAVLLAVGAMNLLWMALLTVLVLLEKFAPGRKLVPRLSGAGLIISAGLLLLT